MGDSRRNKQKTKRHYKHKSKADRYDWSTIGSVLTKLYEKLVVLIQYMFNLCRSQYEAKLQGSWSKCLKECTNICKNACKDTCKDNEERSKGLTFALFDVVKCDDKLQVKQVSWKRALRRYCQNWLDLIGYYGFSNPQLGIPPLVLYPFITLYLLSCSPAIIWYLISYQISWWLYTLGISIALLIVTIPIYLICLILCVMCLVSTWIPILGAMLGVGGIGWTDGETGAFGCPILPNANKNNWLKLTSYFCFPPIIRPRPCKDHCDSSDSSNDSSCDTSSESCEATTTKPTTTEPTTTEATTTQDIKCCSTQKPE